MANHQMEGHVRSSALSAVSAAAALAGLVMWSWRQVDRTRRARRDARAAPVSLQTWEDEGGRPVETGRITPSVAP